MSHLVEKNISTLVADQFPEFYNTEGPVFVDFVRTYYQWMETTGQALDLSRNFSENRDIDTTIDSFVIHFKKKYLAKLPDTNVVGNRKLVKHIGDIYASKGSRRSFELLFRLLFNKEAEIFYPDDNVLKASDGIWFQPVYLELSSSIKTKTFVQQEIVGSASGAKAFAESFIRRLVSGKIVDILFLSNIRGNFITGELITSVADNSYVDAPTITGSLTTITVLNGGANNAIGDTFDVISDTGVQGKIRVTAIEEGTGRVTFEILDGGTGYTLDSTTHVIVSDMVMALNNIEWRDKLDNQIDVNNEWGQLDAIPPSGWSLNGAAALQQWNFQQSGWNTNQVEVWQVTANSTSFAGGYDTPVVTIDPTQTYRFIVPVKRDDTGGGTFALGMDDVANILDLDGTAAANAQFLTAGANTINMPTANQWYVALGYIYPHDHVDTTNNGGLFNVETGAKEANVAVLSYKWKDATIATAGLEAHFESTPDGAIRYTDKPVLELIDGTVSDSAFVVSGYNSDPTAFERFDVAKQTLFNLPYTNMLPTATAFVVGDYVTGIDAGGLVSHGHISAITANTGDDTGTVQISSITGDWTAAANVEVNDDLFTSQTSANALIGTAKEVSPTANVTGSNTTHLAVHAAGYINEITIDDGGSDYDVGDILTFTGGGIKDGPETAAIATVSTISANVITGINISDPGAGYDSAPVITVSGGTGANLNAVIVKSFLNANIQVSDALTHAFGNVSFVSTGSDATFDIGSLTGPTETLNLFTDLLDGQNSQNRSYLDIFVDGANSDIGFIGSITVDTIGTGYTNTDTLTYTGGGEAVAGIGTVTTFGNASVDFVTVTTPGSGYDSIPPTLTDTSTNEDATFTPNMDFGYGFPKSPNGDLDDIIESMLESNTFTIGEIATLTAINPGSSYNADPMVVVINPLISGFNRRDLILSIDTLSGSFIDGERLEQTITTDDFVANVDSTAGFANNDGVNQFHANGDVAALGLARVVDIGNTEITILPFNGTTFVDTLDLALSANNLVNTDVNSITNASVETFAKGEVKTSNATHIEVKRTTFNVAFDSNFPVIGDESTASANVVQVISDANSSPMGDNAVISANVETASGIASSVEIVDSGFNYLDNEIVSLQRDGNIFAITGTANLIKQGRGEGFWLNNRGKLNSDMFLHDNDFYQEYSYEVRVGLSLDQYSQILKDLLHVSGTRLFGNVIIPAEVSSTVSVSESSLVQTSV